MDDGMLALAASSMNIAGSAVGSNLNFRNSRRLEQIQFEHNQELMRLQNELNFDQWSRAWQMNNEYNSAAAQVQRLKDAGLNPAMAFGDGMAPANSTPSGTGLGSSSIPSLAPMDLSGFGSAFVDMWTALQSTKAQTALAKSQEDLNKLTGEGVHIDNQFRGILHEKDIEQIDSQINLANANAEYSVQQKFLAMDQRQQNAFMRWYNREQLNLDRQRVDLQSLSTEHQVSLWDLQGKAAIANANAANMQGRAALMNANTQRGYYNLEKPNLEARNKYADKNFESFMLKNLYSSKEQYYNYRFKANTQDSREQEANLRVRMLRGQVTGIDIDNETRGMKNGAAIIKDGIGSFMQMYNGASTNISGSLNRWNQSQSTNYYGSFGY